MSETSTAAAATVAAFARHTVHWTKLAEEKDKDGNDAGIVIVAAPGDKLEVPASEAATLVARGAIVLIDEPA